MPDTPAIHQQLGQLIEANNRAREDRREMRDDMGKLHESMTAVRQAIQGLTQSSQSVATQVGLLALEKCGDRLTALEKVVFDEINVAGREKIHDLENKIKTWEKWIGTGWAFVGRLVIALAASGVFWGAVLKVGSWVASLH